MTLFSQLNLEDSNPELALLLDKQANGFAIEAIVQENKISYLEAATQFLEENSIPESNFNKFIPSLIIEKIKDEAVKDHMLRPTVAKKEQTTSLDFLL